MDKIAKTDKANKLKRIVTGWIIGLLALGCLLLGGIALLLLLLVIIYFGAGEFVKILETKGFKPSFGIMYASAVIFSLVVFFHRFDLIPVALTISIIAAFLGVLFRGRQPYIANVATTVLGVMYGAFLPLHILLIRQIGAVNVSALKMNFNEGLYLVILVFLIVIATDIGGYYVGRKFGKTPLSPVISPKKTVEGAIGATAFALIVASLGVFYTNLTLLQAVMTGFLVSIAAQLGDLSESLIKRDAGVKDSGTTLPGHGGFLDRTDSFVFALPVAYYYFICFTQGHNIILEFFSYAKGVLNALF